MKMVYISCNISALSEVKEMLTKCEMKSWQVIENATGRFSTGDPRMNDAIWPGVNSVVFVQPANDEKYRELVEAVKEKNSTLYNEDERVLLMSWEAIDYIYKEEA